MKRFTKAQAIADIQARADSQQAAHKFDLNNGTTQLVPRGADAATEEAIRRAVAYGALRALESVATDSSPATSAFQRIE